jgi:predicted nucleic acid-binding protein
VAGVVYDTGVLLAAERRDRRMWAVHHESLALDVVPVVPVVVLAQAWRGGPQPELSRLLRGCEVTADSEAIGRAAGRACALAGTADVVDAIVVVTALQREAVVFTRDPGDLNRLTDALGARLRTRRV